MKFYLRKAVDYVYIGTVNDGSTLEEVLSEVHKTGRTTSVREQNSSYAIILIY